MNHIVKVNDVSIQTSHEINSPDEIAMGIFARLLSSYLRETEENKSIIMGGISAISIVLGKKWGEGTKQISSTDGFFHIKNNDVLTKLLEDLFGKNE